MEFHPASQAEWAALHQHFAEQEVAGTQSYPEVLPSRQPEVPLTPHAVVATPQATSYAAAQAISHTALRASLHRHGLFLLEFAYFRLPKS